MAEEFTLVATGRKWRAPGRRPRLSLSRFVCGESLQNPSTDEENDPRKQGSDNCPSDQRLRKRGFSRVWQQPVRSRSSSAPRICFEVTAPVACSQRRAAWASRSASFGNRVFRVTFTSAKPNRSVTSRVPETLAGMWAPTALGKGNMIRGQSRRTRGR
jgi:hypothetical protein